MRIFAVCGACRDVTAAVLIHRKYEQKPGSGHLPEEGEFTPRAERREARGAQKGDACFGESNRRSRSEMAEHHAASDGKHKASGGSGSSVHGNSRAGGAAGAGGRGGLSGGLSQPAGWQSLLCFSILFLACLAGFSSRLFAVIRFESIIHEFDPW